jgi:PAS domain S-box-containing protein
MFAGVLALIRPNYGIVQKVPKGRCMSWIPPYLILLYISVAIAVALNLLLWPRRSVPGVKPLMALLLGVTEWALGSAIQLNQPTLDGQLFFSRLQYLGITLIPIAWLTFTTQFSRRQKANRQKAVRQDAGRKQRLAGVGLLGLCIEPVLVNVLVWTNDYHHLIWSQAILLSGYSVPRLALTFQFGFWIHAVYSYAVVLVGIYHLVHIYLASAPRFRRQILSLIIAALLPMVLNILFVVGLSPVPVLDMTPIAFVFTGLALAWGVRRYWLFELLPLARTIVIDALAESVLVLDTHHRVVDLNQAACQIFDTSPGEIIGKPARQVFSRWPIILSKIDLLDIESSRSTGLQKTAQPVEALQVDSYMPGRHYEVQILPIQETASVLIGWLVIWTDITAHVLAAEALQSSEERYRQSVDKSPNPIFSVDRDSRIQSWNPACESTFQYGLEILSHPCAEIFADSLTMQKADGLISRVFEEGLSARDVDLTYRCRDGSSLFTLSRVYPIMDDDGRVHTCVFANTDISERRMAEDALRRQLQEISVLHAISAACVVAPDEDELIERVTEIIGNSLFPSNFGILLPDEQSGGLRLHPSYRGLPEEFKGHFITPGHGITWAVAQSGRPIRVDDVSQDSLYTRFYFRARSELCVPIKAGECVIGIINAESETPRAFSESDERILTTLAGQLATAIERLRAAEAERRRVAELLSITRIGREINSVLDLNQVLNSIVRHAAQTSSSDACGLFIYRPENGRLYLEAAYGVGRALVDACNLEGVPVEGSVMGQAVLEKRPVQVVDVHEEPGYQMRSIADIENIRAILALPMYKGDEVIGGLVLWNRAPQRFPHEREVFLQALSQQSVNAIFNARLFKLEHEKRELAEVLRETSNNLGATLKMEEVVDRLLNQVFLLVPYDAANFMLIEGAYARVLQARGYDEFDPGEGNWVLSLSVEITKLPSVQLMIKSRQPVIISDTRSDAKWIDLGRGKWVGSFAGVPIVYQDRVVALFGLDKAERDFYKPEHAESLAMFASQAGLALQNARLFEETQRRASHLEALNAIIAAAVAAGDITALMETVLDQTFKATGLKRGAIRVGERHITHSISAEILPMAIKNSQPLGMDRSKMVCVEDLQGEIEDFEFQSLAPLLLDLDLRATLIVPILAEGIRIGGILVGSNTPHRWETDEVALVQAIGQQVGVAFERLSLLEETQTRLREVVLLSKVITLTATSTDMITALTQVCSEAAHFFRAQQAAFALLNAEGTEAEIITEYRQEGRPSALGARIPVLDNPSMQYILEQKIPLAISDAQTSPLLAPIHDLMRQRDVFSIMIVPILLGGRVAGTIGIDILERREFDPSDVALMQNIARQVAQSLERLRLFNETNRRAAHQEGLNAIITAAVTESEPSSLLDSMMSLTLEALNLDHGVIWINELSRQRNLDQEFMQSLNDLARMHTVHLEETGCIADWRQIPDDHPLKPLADLFCRYNLHASISVPILSERRSIGGLTLFSTEMRAWLQDEHTLVDAVGMQVGSALERLLLLAKPQEQARQMQQIMDTVPEGVILLDTDRRIQLANPAAWEYLHDLARGVKANEVLLALDSHPIEKILQPQGEPWLSIEAQGPAARVYEAAARALENKAGRHGWVLVIRDITLERQNLARVQMQDRLATVGQLAAGIAHDFNNIMAAIVVYTDLLAMEPQLSKAGQDRLSTIQQQVQRATSLIRQILDFSRRSVMEQSELDLLPFVKELDRLLDRVLPENIQLELTYQPGSYLVKADPARLQQVFMNLALNARDAMPDGGKLHFTLQHLQLSQEGPLPLPDLVAGDWICLRVRDEGIGIDPETMLHIFDPFFTTKPVGKGTGLGLAQVYGIIKQHGGSIGVTSQVGEGTMFSMYLPALPAHVEQADSSLRAARVSGRGQTVLLAEDDEAARDALLTLLEAHHYRVLAARDGKEALELYEQEAENIKLVVSDLVMPEMGGMALYGALRDRTPEIKMLLITGHPLDACDQEVLENGKLHWMQKPFSVQEFACQMQKLLDGPNGGGKSLGKPALHSEF